MMPTMNTADSVAMTTLPSAITPAIIEITPNATIHPHFARRGWMASASGLRGPVLSVVDMVASSLRNKPPGAKRRLMTQLPPV